MFSVSMGDVPYVRNHAEALKFFHDAVPWRGSDDGDERPLINKRHRQYGVRLDGTDVAFRMHYTDVIVWHADNSVTINTFPSRSTCEFATNFLPFGTYLSNEAAHLYVNGWVYPVAGKSLRILSDDTVADNNSVFAKRTVNRKNARALLATTNYAEYRKWYGVMSSMTGRVAPWNRNYIAQGDATLLLADSEQWHELMMSNAGTPDQVRERIYNEQGYNYDVWDTEIRDRMPRDATLRGWEVRHADK